MSWLSRREAQTVERALRESWPRALVRIVGIGLIMVPLGALFGLLVGPSWIFGAVLTGCLSIMSGVVSRSLTRLDARKGTRT